MTPSTEPITDEAGEARELTAADFARGRRGAPWTGTAEQNEAAQQLRARAKTLREIADSLDAYADTLAEATRE